MRLGKEEAVGYVEDTLADAPVDVAPVNSPLTVEEVRADQPLTPAPEPLRVS